MAKDDLYSVQQRVDMFGGMGDGMSLMAGKEELVWVLLATGRRGRWWWRQGSRSEHPDVKVIVDELADEGASMFECRMDESESSVESIAMLYKLRDILNARRRATVMEEIVDECG